MRCTIAWLCSVSLCLVQVFSADSDRPVAETPSGTYRGHILNTRNGRDILAFQGIPYALPPTGQLRFKDPVKAPKVEGIYEANDESRDCFQPTLDFSQFKNLSTFAGSEDCLYLNVYKPQVGGEKGPLPVLVWIHGGGFFAGSGSTFWNGPGFILDKDMIMVTMNYRLGILGFLSTGDSVIPGNLGMKDQVLALQWVKENIASFGGDPNSVTVGGVSAGGVSASLQMHSPLSKGLFQRAIAQSGTAYCPFSTKSWKRARTDATKVANYLGCSSDSKQLLKCLQKMHLHQLIEAANSIIPPEVIMSMDFLPVVEKPSQGAFLTKSSLKEPSQMPLIAGVTSNECVYMARDLIKFSPKYNDVDDVLKDIKNSLPLLGFYSHHPKKDEVTEELAKFYFGGGVEDATEAKFIECYSDLMFNHGLHVAGKKEKGPTFLYKFSYASASPIRPPVEGLEGVSHGEESMYLYDMKLFQRGNDWPEEDTELSHKIVGLWYNFIRSGDPSPDSKLWEESQGGIKYLDFTNQGFSMKSNMFQPRMNFLDKLNIFGTHSEKHDEL